MLSFLSSLLLLLLLLLLLPFIHARPPPIFTLIPKNTSSQAQRHSYSWHEFERLRDASRGTLVHGISNLKKYLTRFGYLPPRENYMNLTDVFDSKLELAIARYQQKLGLPVSGKLDFPTVSELMSPRCGVPDFPKTPGKYVYFTGRPRWGRNIPMKLTYAFSPKNMIRSLSVGEIQGAFRRSFARWAAVAPITFVESGDYGGADIKIGFYSGDHGDGEAFDGVLGVLAHAFSPESGRFHLDAAETWAVDFAAERAESAVDLESVATHEIGHLLGLGHTEVRDAVMYPSLRPRERKVDLRIDDVRGVQALYGSNPNFSLGDLSESDMFSNGGGGRRRVGEDELVGFKLVVLFILCLCM